MEAIRFAAEIVRHPEGTYVATCAATPGCLGTGPTPNAALHALHKAVRGFLEPALKHCSQTSVSVRVVAPGIQAPSPSERESGAIPVGWIKGSPQ